MTDNNNNLRNLKSLPKAELHLHLEGAMRRSTLVELCTKYSIEIPKDTANQRFKDFSAFVDVYVAACQCLQEPNDVRRLLKEVAEDAKESGAVWIEIAPSLTFYAQNFGGLDDTLNLLAEAAQEAEIATGVGIGYIISAERHLGVEPAEQLAHVAKNGAQNLRICGRPAVVGFGLHGPEEGNPPNSFVPAFEIACSPPSSTTSTDPIDEDDSDGGASVLVASLPHAGEIAPFPGEGPKSVLDAITCLKAKRIAHGVLAANNDDVLQAIIDSKVCLDVCVTSNYLLNVVPTLQSHPILKLIKTKKLPVTINSDDPLLFGCTLLSEYEVCRNELKMDDTILARCAKHSFEYSCAPEDFKNKHINDIERWLSSAFGIDHIILYNKTRSIGHI